VEIRENYGFARRELKQIARVSMKHLILDADLYVPGLLEGFLGSKKWMAARLGQVGGKSRTRAKRVASRANGKLGGRPKKAMRG
jgi:hypothetical protein